MRYLLALFVVMASVSVALATPVPVTNPSFESQVLGEYAILAGPPTGWGHAGGTHYIKNPGPGDGPGAVTDGDNALFSIGAAGQYFQIFQNLGNAIDESKTYTLSVDLWVDPAETATWFGMKYQILAPTYREVGTGGVGVPPPGPIGSWYTVGLPYTPIAGEGGSSFQLFLESSGLYLDNVRVEEIPEPASMALLGLGGLCGLLLMKRRRPA